MISFDIQSISLLSVIIFKWHGGRWGDASSSYRWCQTVCGIWDPWPILLNFTMIPKCCFLRGRNNEYDWVDASLHGVHWWPSLSNIYAGSWAMCLFRTIMRWVSEQVNQGGVTNFNAYTTADCKEVEFNVLRGFAVDFSGLVEFPRHPHEGKIYSPAVSVCIKLIEIQFKRRWNKECENEICI